MSTTRFGGGSDNFNNTSSCTIAWPASMASGYFAVLMCSFYENGGGVVSSTVTGFTNRLASTAYGGAGPNESRMLVWTRDCDSTETGNVTISTTGGNIYGTCALMVLSGAGALTYNGIGTIATGSSTTATASSVSGTAGQALVACFALGDPPGTTTSHPSGMTLGDEDTTSTENSSRMYYEELTSTAATGSRAWVYTNSRDWGAILVTANDAGSPAATELPSLIMPPLRPAGYRR